MSRVSRSRRRWSFDVVVRRLDISRSSTPAFGVCGVVELNGLTLAPPGSAHVFVGVLRSDGRRRVVDDDGRGRFSTARSHFDAKIALLTTKTIFGAPKPYVFRFKRVPLDKEHLGFGGAKNRLARQKREIVHIADFLSVDL